MINISLHADHTDHTDQYQSPDGDNGKPLAGGFTRLQSSTGIQRGERTIAHSSATQKLAMVRRGSTSEIVAHCQVAISSDHSHVLVPAKTRHFEDASFVYLQVSKSEEFSRLLHLLVKSKAMCEAKY